MMGVSAYLSPQRTQSPYKEELPDHPLNPFHKPHHVEIDEKAYTDSAKLEIGQHLRLVHGEDRFHRLDLHQDDFFHSQVYSIGGLYPEALVHDRQRDLGLHAKPNLLQLAGERFVVRTFEQPGTK